MKKLLLFILVALSATGLSVTASYAGPTTYNPGCSSQMMSILTNQANAVRARDKAYEMEIVSRAPSTLYLTCFDQAMVLSSRLGYIFSDNINPDPPPADTVAYTGSLAYPNWGASHSGLNNVNAFINGKPVYYNLAMDLSQVVNPMLDQWLGGTASAPATYNFYPKWTPSSDNQLNYIEPNIKQNLDQIYNWQMSTGLAWNQGYIQLVNQIVNLLKNFPTDSWSSLSNHTAQYWAYLSGLQSYVSQLESARSNYIGPRLTNVKNDIFNAKMTCTNLDDVWDGNGAFNSPDNTATTFYPPEGPYNVLTPFYSMEDILNYGNTGTLNATLAVPPATSSPSSSVPSTFYFNTELKTSTDTGVLQSALNDLVNTLSKPGQTTMWPGPPSLPSYYETQDVIQHM